MVDLMTRNIKINDKNKTEKFLSHNHHNSISCDCEIRKPDPDSFKDASHFQKQINL